MVGPPSCSYCRMAIFVLQGRMEIKRLHERYIKEGIVIPYPIRAINYEQEKE